MISKLSPIYVYKVPIYLDSILAVVLVVVPEGDALGWGLGRVPHTQTDVVNKGVFKCQTGWGLQAVLCTSLK